MHDQNIYFKNVQYDQELCSHMVLRNIQSNYKIYFLVLCLSVYLGFSVCVTPGRSPESEDKAWVYSDPAKNLAWEDQKTTSFLHNTCFAETLIYLSLTHWMFFLAYFPHGEECLQLLIQCYSPGTLFLENQNIMSHQVQVSNLHGLATWFCINSLHKALKSQLCCYVSGFSSCTRLHWWVSCWSGLREL